MKKFLCLILTVLFLAGCSAGTAEETTAPTESSVSIMDQAQPWDRDGILMEVPLTIPESWKYSNFLTFGEDLLVWYLDTHLENEAQLGLCLVDLQTGSVAAKNELTVGGWLTPQVLGENIYLCDNFGGQVLELDSTLQLKQQWQVPAGDSVWYMGAKNTLYRLTGEQGLIAQKLDSGETTALLPEASQVNLTGEARQDIPLEYYDSNLGAHHNALLDLTAGEVAQPPFAGSFYSISRAGDFWLGNLVTQDSIYYIGSTQQAMRIRAENSQLYLLKEGYLLEIPYDGMYLRLYDTDGKLISQCCVSEDGSSYAGYDMIWQEELGGYFFRLSDYNGSTRLLFWDISKSCGGQDLVLEAVPAPSEATLALREKADAMEEKYGLMILVGEECSTEFDSFRAEIVEDYETVNTALDTLDGALSKYPEGFFRQLRYGSVQGIQIQLIGNLEATDEERKNGSYSAFVQEQWDKNLMVADVYSCYTQSYYHEISHIIDNYLYWDSWQREDALYCEEGWMALNPEGFDYAYDYSVEFGGWLSDDLTDYFADIYATISPTEDRARVMEYAMADGGGWTFQEHRGMYDKLEYYSRCIRDAFDTESWPKDLPWEQYLK